MRETVRPGDMMAVCLARLIHNGDRVFHGVSSHLPMIAVLLARHTHAPEAVHLNIPGGVNPEEPTLRSFTSAGSELWESAEAAFPLMDVFDLSMRGGLDVAFLSGVQFDQEGRVNASVIGDYRRPKVRLPGGAGSAVLIPTAKRAVIWRTKHDRRTFTERVEATAWPRWRRTRPSPCSTTRNGKPRRPRRKRCGGCGGSTPGICGASSSGKDSLILFSPFAEGSLKKIKHA